MANPFRLSHTHGWDATGLAPTPLVALISLRYQFGQECLDRISISLGGNAIVPAAGVLLPAWLQDADWKKRHATLICLAQIAEGCAKVWGNVDQWIARRNGR